MPSQADFVLAHLGDDAGAVVRELADRHQIHIRHAAGFGFPRLGTVSMPASLTSHD